MRCMNPILVKGIYVPCGKCPVCRSMQRLDMSTRLYLETQVSAKSSFFVTLTYSDEHLPLCNGVPCFDKKSVQKFIKRLRKELSLRDILLRYFLTSEYGDLNLRPHYHAIFIFDKDLSISFIRELIDKYWFYGRTSVDPVSFKDIQYTTCYALKDADYFNTDYGDDFVDCKPFRLFSNKPGIGAPAIDWIQEYLINGGDVRSFFTISGNRCRIPRYIRNKLPDKLKRYYSSQGLQNLADEQEDLKKIAFANSKPVLTEKGLYFEHDYKKEKDLLDYRMKVRRDRKKLKKNSYNCQ